MKFPKLSFYELKVTGHQNFNFFVEFPPSVQDFCVIKHVPLNARVSGYLDLKFHKSAKSIENNGIL